MRVAFYSGILTFAWPFLTLFLWDDSILEMVGFLFIWFLPFAPLLLIPAIQLRSWRLVFRALWLGPVLMIADQILCIFLTVDNRNLSEMPLLVPGGWNQMNPGGPIDNLIPNLVIYIALITFALARNYGKTRILGCSYVARILIGGIILLVVLPFEINLTEVRWSEVMSISFDKVRVHWAIASTSWLCLSGIYWAFVFGVQPEKKESAIEQMAKVSDKAVVTPT